ncbi:MAG: peptide chain release factor N(5)-glutamine methyltransferase [Balneolaceae bacterium]|nr:MAG: peptide chain release factor N(5)-glutamine methyltransferase [Balneolaceae bacterium]
MKESDRLWTVLAMLEWGTGYFEQREIPDPRLSMEWLLADLLSLKRLDLYLQFDRPLTSGELQKIKPLIRRRAGGEPLQYITGSAQFMDVVIHVNPSVLIPRMETEQLVELILEETESKKSEPLRLIDLGTGSGCIPVSIKKERPAWYCAGTDISPEALETAAHNATVNGVEVDVTLRDILSEAASEERWDIVVSNPPYIKPEERGEMHRQVLDFEPALALFHPSPLTLYDSVIRFARALNAQLFLECNDKTALEVAALAKRFFPNTQLRNDLDGLPRFVVSRP